MKILEERCGGWAYWVCLPPHFREDAGYPLACLLLNSPGSGTMEQAMTILSPKIQSGILPPFLLAGLAPEDPNGAYTPWLGKAVFRGGGDFGGRAGETVRFLEERFLPGLESRFPVLPRPALLGYSLAGLCALYALYETDRFGSFGSLSGSLWYEGWLPFMEGNRPKNGAARVYLSLGSGEERSRNPVLATMGERTRAAARLLRGQLPQGGTFYEESPGGHFKDVPQRHARALEWLMEKDPS